MLIEHGVVKVGMEIEVASFGNKSYKYVARRLIENDFMFDDGRGNPLHDYHCKCDYGCKLVRSGKTIYDPIVTMCYDASLPANGAEFVTSTVILADEGLAALRPIWDIVTEKAEWRNDLRNRREDGQASPSIHLHVSATSPGIREEKLAMLPEAQWINDVTHVLSLYGPEMIAIANCTEYSRGLEFRQPLRFASHKGHHGFIHVRQVIPDQMVYIEWRMFEAAYNDWNYVESAAFFCAVLTRALLYKHNFAQLMGMGYQNPIDEQALLKAVKNDDLEGLLALVSRDRLLILRNLCMDEINDDEYGGTLLNALFDRVEAQI